MLPILFIAILFSSAEAIDVYMGGFGPRVGVELAPSVTPVRVGGEASLYWNRNLRSSALFDLGFAERRVNITTILITEYLGPIGPTAFSVGGGLGYGHDWYWDGAGARRRMHSLPFRVSTGFLVKDGPREAHLRLVGEWRAPVAQTLRGSTSVTPDLGRGTTLSFGMELVVLFGDFTPRRKPSRFDGKPLPVDDP